VRRINGDCKAQGEHLAADYDCDLICDLMAYGPNIPGVEHEIFREPPLKAMLGQVRFPPVLRIADLGSLSALQETIRAEFPKFAQEQQVTLMVGPGVPQGPVTSNAFRFSTSDGAWSVALAPDAMTLEADVTVRYTSYAEFAERFGLVWAALAEHFAPSQVLRQGLRYVSHVESSRAAADWAELINDDLLGPLVGAFGEGVAQSVSELRFPQEDGVLVFKHGMLPLGPEQNMGYLLDFDYFTEEPEDDVSVAALAARFDRFHDLIYRFFRWCVTDLALEEFRGAD
jgi:uncharacterized protein (TIGR04255 family)